MYIGIYVYRYIYRYIPLVQYVAHVHAIRYH